MKYRKLGGSGIDVSVIGQGSWGLGNDFFGETDVSEWTKAIHKSLEMGVNMVDTAPGYGLHFESEYALGKALEGRRDKAVLATKLGILRYGAAYVHCLDPMVMRMELEGSLKRLKTDYIDLYYIHWPDKNTPIETAIEQLAKFKQEGKILAIGVSNFTVEQIETARSVAQIDAVQPPLNILDRSSIENDILGYCAQNDISIVTYGTLGGGILAGKRTNPVAGGNELRSSFYRYYDEEGWNKAQKFITELRTVAERNDASVAEVSINWVLKHDGVVCALMGARTEKTAAENAKAADWELSDADFVLIEEAYKRTILT